MTHLIVGQYENGKVHLFDMPVVAVRNGLQAGDIVKVEHEFVRMYEDGDKGLRSHFITDEVKAAYDERRADYEGTIDDFLMGTGWM